MQTPKEVADSDNRNYGTTIMHRKDGIMTLTAAQQSHFGNIQKAYQENPLTFDDVLKLLGVEELPFLDTPDLKAFAITGTISLLQRHSPEWIKEHRVRLIEDLEQIAEM